MRVLTATTAAVSASASKRCERAADLSTMKAKMNYLVDSLGVTQVQAHHMIRAYKQDLADALRIGNDTKRSDAGFIAWLMELKPHRFTFDARLDALENAA